MKIRIMNDQSNSPKQMKKKPKKGFNCRNCGKKVPYISRYCPICGEEHRENEKSDI